MTTKIKNKTRPDFPNMPISYLINQPTPQKVWALENRIIELENAMKAEQQQNEVLMSKIDLLLNAFEEQK